MLTDEVCQLLKYYSHNFIDMIVKSALNSSIMTFVPLLLVLFDFVLSAVSVCVRKTTLKLRKARGF